MSAAGAIADAFADCPTESGEGEDDDDEEEDSQDEDDTKALPQFLNGTPPRVTVRNTFIELDNDEEEEEDVSKRRTCPAVAHQVSFKISASGAAMDAADDGQEESDERGDEQSDSEGASPMFICTQQTELPSPWSRSQRQMYPVGAFDAVEPPAGTLVAASAQHLRLPDSRAAAPQHQPAGAPSPWSGPPAVSVGLIGVGFPGAWPAPPPPMPGLAPRRHAGAERKAQRVSLSALVEEDSKAAAIDVEIVPRERRAPEWSRGAMFHSCGSCKPCGFFWKPKGCLSGKDCCHCHLCPAGTQKARRMDRKWGVNARSAHY